MSLSEITAKTREVPFVRTPNESHYQIRRPLIDMYGLESKEGCWSNPYTPKNMIPDDESAPIFQLTKGVDAKVKKMTKAFK